MRERRFPLVAAVILISWLAAGPVASASAPETQVVYRIGRGATIDLGWTGIAHGQAWPFGQLLGFEMRCPGGDTECEVRGGAPGASFGPPVPLSSGGIPVCVVNRLRKAVTGTLLPARGCGNLRLELEASVIMAQDVGRPCPVCAGDRTARDGVKDGHCDGGANDGAPCDVVGESVAFGATSSDCPPKGDPVGTLPIDVALTTGSIAWAATEACGGGATARCFCPGQAAPNACFNGHCALAKCIKGPLDGVCVGAPFRSCRPGSGDADCEARFHGAGKCEVRPRPCFDERLEARGECNAYGPKFVGTFCTPATKAPALNASTGLPGPARLVLPLELVNTPATPTPGARR